MTTKTDDRQERIAEKLVESPHLRHRPSALKNALGPGAPSVRTLKRDIAAAWPRVEGEVAALQDSVRETTLQVLLDRLEDPSELTTGELVRISAELRQIVGYARAPVSPE